MENSPRLQDNPIPCLVPSPKSYSPNSSSSSSSASSNGLHHHHHHHRPPPTPPPQFPVPITRSEPNNPVKNHSIPPIKSATKKDKSTSRLYERRNSLKNFRLSLLAPGFVNRSVFSSNSPRPGTRSIFLL